MDIQRSNRPEATQPASANSNRSSRSGKKQKWLAAMKVTSVVLLFSITILLVALLAYAATNRKTSNSEATLVDTSKYQAVFLVNQQLPYFGKITALNKDFIVLEDIYYLQINQAVQPGQENQPQDITLVKLGCELHGPEDKMVINSDQLFFWENLKDNDNDSKVNAAIKQFQSQNPNGLKCETNTQSTTN